MSFLQILISPFRHILDMILKSCGTLDRDTLLAKVHAYLTALGDDVRQCGGQSAEPMRIPIDKFQILKVC
jgi:hypothetical protein